jgi:hypothetical protein
MLRGVLWNANIPSLAEPLRSGGQCSLSLVGGHPSGHMKSLGNTHHCLPPFSPLPSHPNAVCLDKCAVASDDNLDLRL